MYRWFDIGIQLGIPHHKLKEFEKEHTPFIAAMDYWLNGNVEGISVCWESLVAALSSSHVMELGLANTISAKYCQQNNIQEDKGMYL